MDLRGIIKEQKDVCFRFGAEYVENDLRMKIGISRNFKLDNYPLNGLRHPVTTETTGWYVWSGEDFSSDQDFFVPIHAAHLLTRAAILIKYLGLASGWRFLIAPGQEDVWRDQALLFSD